MDRRNQRSKSGPSPSIETVNREGRNWAARKTLLVMREKLLAEGLGKLLLEDLVPSFDIGDEADHADTQRAHEVSILLSARDKEKVFAIEEALEKIQEGTYGICEECGDEIGSGRLKAMPLAKLCIACQSQNEKDIAHQRLAEQGINIAL